MQFMSDSIILNHYVRARQGKENIVILFVYLHLRVCVCVCLRSFPCVTSPSALETNALDMHATHVSIPNDFFFAAKQNLQHQISFILRAHWKAIRYLIR